MIKKKKKVLGYIVYNHTGVNGLGYGEEESKVLWLGGSHFTATLFKTRAHANKAIKRTEEYAVEKAMYKDGPWFNHYILAVTGEK
jgi:hypothetical protein